MGKSECRSQKIQLSNDEVHIWQARLNLKDQQIQRLRLFLSSSESKRADRLYSKKGQDNFVISRGFLRVILASYLECSPAGIQLSYSASGKPELENQELSFNVSHSRDFALYAVHSNQPLGLDVEFVRPVSNLEKLTQRFFSNKEHQELCSIEPGQQHLAFFKKWTQKEAYLKATGQGLSALKKAEVPTNCGRWFFYSLEVEKSYVSSLVVGKSNLKLNYYSVEENLF